MRVSSQILTAVCDESCNSILEIRPLFKDIQSEIMPSFSQVSRSTANIPVVSGMGPLHLPNPTRWFAWLDLCKIQALSKWRWSHFLGTGKTRKLKQPFRGAVFFVQPKHALHADNRVRKNWWRLHACARNYQHRSESVTNNSISFGGNCSILVLYNYKQQYPTMWRRVT